MSVCLFLLLVSDILARQSYRHFNVNDGLASSVVHDLLLDQKGYLWIATDAGVNMYDGSRFRQFTTSDGLGGNEILKLFEDSHGRIWFLSFNGSLSFFDNGRFSNPDNYALLNELRLPSAITNIYEDDSGAIWIVSEAGHIARMLNNQVRWFNFGLFESINIRQIWKRDQYVYVGTFGGLFRFMLDDKNWEKIDDTEYWSIRNFTNRDGITLIPNQKGITSEETAPKLLYDLNDLGIAVHEHIHPLLITPISSSLLVGTYSGGIYFYEHSHILTGKTYRWLQGHTITSMISDREGAIWIGTLDDGIYRIDRGFLALRNLSESDGVTSRVIRSSTVDRKGHLWFGGVDGMLYRFSPDGKLIWSGYTSTPYSINNSIEALFEISDNVLAVGSVNGLALIQTDSPYYLQRNPRPQNFSLHARFLVGPTSPQAIKSLYGNRDTLYYGTNRYLYRLTGKGFNTSEKLATIRITSTHKDVKGNLWIGTVDGVKKLGQFGLEDSDIDVLNRVQITDIRSLHGSWMGISTYGNGFVLVCTQTGVIRVLNTDSGLPSNLVRSSYLDDDGVLWIITRDGLSKLDLSHQIRSTGNTPRSPITTFNNLVNIPMNHFNKVVVQQELAWLSGNHGITLLERDFEGPQQITIPLILERVMVNNRSIEPDTFFNVGANQNQWEFHFNGILLSGAAQLQYKYRIPELSEEWSVSESGVIGFSYLKPGDYTIQVRAFTPDHRIMSDTFVVTLLIDIPYYLRPWFLFIFGGLLLIGVILIVHQVVRNAAEKQKRDFAISLRTNELEHQALLSMMNPHSTFNLINSLRFHLLKKDPDKASNLLMKYTKLLRLQLDAAYKKEIRLIDEVSRLKLFIELESEKLPNGINFHCDIEKHIDQEKTLIPALLLQPFLENSIKHGILPGRVNGEIYLIIKTDGLNRIEIQLLDNGIGFPPESEFRVGSEYPEQQVSNKLKRIRNDEQSDDERISMGIQLTMERLKLISKESGSPWYMKMYNFSDIEGNVSGVRVEILLPIRAKML